MRNHFKRIPTPVDFDAGLPTLVMLRLTISLVAAFVHGSILTQIGTELPSDGSILTQVGTELPSEDDGNTRQLLEEVGSGISVPSPPLPPLPPGDVNSEVAITTLVMELTGLKNFMGAVQEAFDKHLASTIDCDEWGDPSCTLNSTRTPEPKEMSTFHAAPITVISQAKVVYYSGSAIPNNTTAVKAKELETDPTMRKRFASLLGSGVNVTIEKVTTEIHHNVPVRCSHKHCPTPFDPTLSLSPPPLNP